MALLSEMIEAAAAIIAPDNSWCQGAGGRDADGGVCPVGCEGVVQRCADGAVYQMSLDLGLATPQERYKAYSQTVGFVENFVKEKHKKSLIKFNDDKEQTQAGVIEMLKTAATRAREIEAKQNEQPVQLG